MGKFLVVVALVLFVSGCATSSKVPDYEIQNMRLSIERLQTKIDAKETEMGQLKYELDEVKRQCAAKVQVKAEALSKTAIDSAIANIIRVEGVSGMEVQSALKSAGYYAGALDGKVGPKTQEAIKEFQKAKGIKVDGIIGKETWAQLKTLD